jgi:hypothetical protein
MTLGAIHECRRVEVYSKAKGSDWFHTYLDLDEIEKSDVLEKEWEIPTPKKLKPTLEDNLEKYLPSDSGTVVVWSKYDRAADKPTVLIEQFRVWLGRTYRYFIWNESVVNFASRHLLFSSTVKRYQQLILCMFVLRRQNSLTIRRQLNFLRWFSTGQFSIPKS